MRHSWDDPEHREFDADGFSVSALRFVGWLDLIAGIIGAILVQVLLRQELGAGTSIVVSVALVIQGLLIWSLFMLLSGIATNLKEIAASSTRRT